MAATAGARSSNSHKIPNKISLSSRQINSANVGRIQFRGYMKPKQKLLFLTNEASVRETFEENEEFVISFQNLQSYFSVLEELEMIPPFTVSFETQLTYRSRAKGRLLVPWP